MPIASRRSAANDHCQTARGAADCNSPLFAAPARVHIGAMKKPTDNPADPFKKALAETTRVMADDPDLGVSYSVDPPGMTAIPSACRRSAAA